jgi:HD-GYP domain-containing protein (c-di-GMP phosphodiesterase class II)
MAQVVKSRYAEFLRASRRAYILGTLAVFINALGIHWLYYEWSLKTALYAIILVLLASVPTGLLDLFLSLRWLRPFALYEQAPNLESARVLYQRMLWWPLLSLERIMGPHLLSLLIAFFTLVALAHRYGGFPLSPRDLSALLPWYPLNAAFHATIEYLTATHQSAQVLQDLRSRWNDALGTAQGPRISLFSKVFAVALLLGALPMAQVALVPWFKLQGYGTAPGPQGLVPLVLWSLAAGLIFLGLGAYTLSREITTPIEALRRGFEALKTGQRGVRLDLPAWDELGQLARGFNEMAQALEVEEAHRQALFLETTAALAAAIEARDPSTRGHSERVGRYARKIAAQMGLEGADEFYLSGLLHDIGKIGIPEAILLKTNPLSPEEFRIVARHPQISVNIVNHIHDLSPHYEAILYHHERLDGSGYPEGRRGEEIPRSARILAVADVWDALTSARPYRGPLPPNEALNLLKQQALDPEAIRALEELWRSGELERELNQTRLPSLR